MTARFAMLRVLGPRDQGAAIRAAPSSRSRSNGKMALARRARSGWLTCPTTPVPSTWFVGRTSGGEWSEPTRI